MKKLCLIASLGIFVFSSCQKVKDPEATAAVKVANEWWVTLDLDGTQDVYGLNHFLMATYNTSANDNTIWIDDYQNGWVVKFKASVDYTNLTFSTTAASNEYYNLVPRPQGATATSVNVTDGKIFPKLGHSRSGNVVDSIHMKVEFDDDPGTIYDINGVERTRFVEDDY